MEKTNLRQAETRAYAEGIISDKKLEIKNEKGQNRIEGTVTVKTSETNFVQYHVYCNQMTKEGKENRVYPGLLTVMNEYKSIADYGVEEADRVRVTGTINLFRSRNTGETRVSYNTNFFNRINDDNYEPRAEFEVEGFIKAIIPEYDKEGDETGRVKVTLLVPTYNGIEPVDLIADEEIGSQLENIYEVGQTTRFFGDIVNNRIVTTTEKPVAFGKPKVETRTSYVNELVITGGEEPYEDEEGARVPYDKDVIKAAMQERENKILEEKNKANGAPKTETRPSGAKRGRVLGF